VLIILLTDIFAFFIIIGLLLMVVYSIFIVVGPVSLYKRMVRARFSQIQNIEKKEEKDRKKDYELNEQID
jgi:hypothetical protein